MKINKQKLNKIKNDEEGFSLVEATVALVILLIVILGVFSVFVYAMNLNVANSTRSKALAVLQQEKEHLRSLKFTTTMINTELLGGVKDSKTVLTDTGEKFSVEITIDDDPFINGIQIDNSKTLKEITLSVSASNPTPGWQTAMPATTIIRRVKAN